MKKLRNSLKKKIHEEVLILEEVHEEVENMTQETNQSNEDVNQDVPKNMSYMLEIVSLTQKKDEQVAPNNNMVNNESDNTNNIIYDYV